MILDEQASTFRFKMTLELERALAERNVYFHLQPGVFRYKDGGFLRSIKGPRIEPFTIYNGNTVFPLGFASYVNASLDPETVVGRYCSIAYNVRVMALDHPIDRVTTNSITYSQYSNIHINAPAIIGGERLKPVFIKQKAATIIEHDVWIGQDALLARGITLGTGCVVAAGSVVTKNVPPYAIVGGNPAKIIRYRFDESLIHQLLTSNWWKYSFSHLTDLPFDNPAQFCETLAEKVAIGQVKPYEPALIDLFGFVRDYPN